MADKTIIIIKFKIVARPNLSFFNSIAYRIFEFGVWIMRLQRNNVVDWKVIKKHKLT